MLGVFQKFQEICNKVREFPEIIEPKVGNPLNSSSIYWANWSQPWNLTFFRIRIFNSFSIIWPKSTRMKNHPYWMVKKSPKHMQNTRKSSKSVGFRGTYFIPPFWKHPVSSRSLHLKLGHLSTRPFLTGKSLIAPVSASKKAMVPSTG